MFQRLWDGYSVHLFRHTAVTYPWVFSDRPCVLFLSVEIPLWMDIWTCAGEIKIKIKIIYIGKWPEVVLQALDIPSHACVGWVIIQQRHLGGSYMYGGVTRGPVPSSFSQMQLNTSRLDYKASSLGITLSVLWEFSRPPEVATGRVSPLPLLGLSLCLTSQNSTGLGRSKGFFPPYKW